jgi:hypothetical protein
MPDATKLLWPGVPLAFCSAALFGLSTPLAKLLLLLLLLLNLKGLATMAIA